MSELFVAEAGQVDLPSGTGSFTTSLSMTGAPKLAFYIQSFSETTPDTMVARASARLGAWAISMHDGTSGYVVGTVGNPDAKRIARSDGTGRSGFMRGTTILDTGTFSMGTTFSAGQMNNSVDNNLEGEHTFAFLALGGSELSVALSNAATSYATGSQTGSHSLGSAPTSVVLLSNSHYQFGDPDNPAPFTAGWSDLTTEWSNSYFVAIGGTNEVAQIGASKIIHSIGDSSLFGAGDAVRDWSIANISSVDASDITFNITNLSPAHAGRGGNNDDWLVTAFSGVDIEVLKATTATSNGTKEYSFSFHPQAIWVQGCATTSDGTFVADLCFFVGVADDSFQQCHVKTDQDGTNRARVGHTNNILWITDPSDDTTLVKASLQSMASDGTVTFNYTVTDGTAYEFGITAFARAQPTVAEQMTAMQPLERPTLPRHTAVPYRTK